MYLISRVSKTRWWETVAWEIISCPTHMFAQLNYWTALLVNQPVFPFTLKPLWQARLFMRTPGFFACLPPEESKGKVLSKGDPYRLRPKKKYDVSRTFPNPLQETKASTTVKLPIGHPSNTLCQRMFSLSHHTLPLTAFPSLLCLNKSAPLEPTSTGKHSWTSLSGRNNSFWIYIMLSCQSQWERYCAEKKKNPRPVNLIFYHLLDM